MIDSGSWLDIAGLPRATFDTLYANGPVVLAGAFAPSGVGVAADDGF
jgi:hypothetical protein